MNLDEFVSDYLACDMEGPVTDREIAAAFAERQSEEPGEKRTYEQIRDETIPRVAYYR
jgi:hypothetical protein